MLARWIADQMRQINDYPGDGSMGYNQLIFDFYLFNNLRIN